MITNNQKDYILTLYEEVGQDCSIVDIDDLTKVEAHEVVKELLEIKNEVK